MEDYCGEFKTVDTCMKITVAGGVISMRTSQTQVACDCVCMKRCGGLRTVFVWNENDNLNLQFNLRQQCHKQAITSHYVLLMQASRSVFSYSWS